MDEDFQDFDYSILSYEEWLCFFFDRPVMPDITDSGDMYYADSGMYLQASYPAKVIEHLTKFCQNFRDVSERFTLPQLNQGIWAILGAYYNHGEHLFDRSVALEGRINCIRSMYHVFADFVAKSEVEVMENCFYMWWDILSESFWSQHNYFYDLRQLDDESWQTLDAMFETLVKILALDDIRTQSYALHGLGHLRHPKVKEVVQNYIDIHHDEWTDEGLKWLELCRDGEVM
jgi:hypothetical protein